jgi:flagellar hook-basal body complex protein FliE
MSSISAISQALPALENGLSSQQTNVEQPKTPFSDLLTDSIGSVNKLEDQARATVDGLMTGTGVDVHTAMIATEKAQMGFELALAVRNKAVAAYQSVMNMQF